MLAKNIVGILILVLNAGGLGFILYAGIQTLIRRILKGDQPEEDLEAAEEGPAKPAIVIDESMIPDEDDLLKDMDLSDLDNLNLDDFE